MADTVELASTVISVGISTQGLGSDIVSAIKGVGGQIGGIGRSAGADFKAGFSTAAAGATKGVEDEAKRLASAIEAQSKKVRAARDAERDSASKVAIAEAKLNELRSSGNAKQSALLTAEDRLTKARRESALATAKAEGESKQLAAAYDASRAAAARASTATEQVGRSYSGLGGKIKSAISGIGRPFQPLVNQADDAGRQSATKYTSAMQSGVKSGLGSLGGLLKGALVAGIAAAGIGSIGSMIAGSITAGSDLQQAIGGVEAVFKGQAGQILAAGEKAAQGVGLSTSAYDQMATTLGAGLKNKGISDFAGQTQNLIGLGADLAAQFGGSTSDAVSAISSLMRGESDPIEKYGVAINETAINAELAAKGQSKLTGAALESAKAQARLDILFRQTKDAQGAFGRESETFAGKQQRAAAAWDSMSQKIGMMFLPALTDAMGFINDQALPAIDGLLGSTNPLGEAFTGIGGAVEGMGAVVRPIFEQIWSVISEKWTQMGPTVSLVMENVTSIISSATTAISTIWEVWGPTVLGIIGAAFDLIGGLFRGFSDILAGIWGVLSGVLTGDWTRASEGLQQITDGLFTVLRSTFDAGVAVIGAVWDGLGAALKGPLDWASANVFTPIGDFVTKTIPDAFSAGVGAIGRAWDGLKEIAAAPVRFVVDIVIGGIVDAFNTISGALGGPKLTKPTLGFARGGLLPGYTPVERGDDLLVPMRRGEGVYVSEAMRDPYERSRMYAMNAAALRGENLASFRSRRGYAEGGVVGSLLSPVRGVVDGLMGQMPGSGAMADLMKGVPGRIIDLMADKVDSLLDAQSAFAGASATGLNPVLLARFNAWNAASGNRFSIVSGWRSSAQQAVLYQRYLAGTGNLAAPPGRSNHERGLAIDHAPNSTAADRARGAGFALYWPMAIEPWHVQGVGLARGGLAGYAAGSRSASPGWADLAQEYGGMSVRTPSVGSSASASQGRGSSLADEIADAIARRLDRLPIRLVGAVDKLADTIGGELLVGYQGG